MADAMTPEQRARVEELADWQKVRYGDDDAAKAALAYWRACGWDVDNPLFDRQTDEREGRIYAFMSGYKAAHDALTAEVEALKVAIKQRDDDMRLREGWFNEVTDKMESQIETLRRLYEQALERADAARADETGGTGGACIHSKNCASQYVSVCGDSQRCDCGAGEA